MVRRGIGTLPAEDLLHLAAELRAKAKQAAKDGRQWQADRHIKLAEEYEDRAKRAPGAKRRT